MGEFIIIQDAQIQITPLWPQPSSTSCTLLPFFWMELGVFCRGPRNLIPALSRHAPFTKQPRVFALMWLDQKDGDKTCPMLHRKMEQNTRIWSILEFGAAEPGLTLSPLFTSRAGTRQNLSVVRLRPIQGSSSFSLSLPLLIVPEDLGHEVSHATSGHAVGSPKRTLYSTSVHPIDYLPTSVLRTPSVLICMASYKPSYRTTIFSRRTASET